MDNLFIFMPFNNISPFILFIKSIPIIVFNNVDLPAPFSPVIAIKLPVGIYIFVLDSIVFFLF